MTTYRDRVVFSYSAGQHYPVAVQVDGVWRCHNCGRRVNRYRDDFGEYRFRHYWRDR